MDIKMIEDIYSFIENSYDEYPFFIEMAGISYCDGSYKISRKDSQLYIFEYILRGQGIVKTEEKEFSAVEGDIYILHKQSNHSYYSDSKNPWIKIWFNAKGPLIDSLINIYKLSSINHISNLDISELFFKILEIAKNSKKSDKEIFSAASLVFHEIIIRLSKVIHANQVVQSPDAIKLKQYLDKKYMADISLKEMGELIFRSPSQTIRIFKNNFGITPYNYLMNKKLEVSKLMLQNTNISIKEISISLSFADEHYFSNYFKSKIGLSPSLFRKTSNG
jgi:AraC family transcriptional regulator, arabinose operon regulatory protein